MSNEHKLLEVLRTIKEELGTLSTAWFTTYALDPLIVENYIIPLLLTQERPRDIYDYEALTTAYAKSKTDIRFFYDPGALIATNPKRTSIPFYPTAASGFGSRFTDGVFHPKIWYLRSVPDGDGISRAVLLVTSANLSISGWADNRESFLLREVVDGDNDSRLRDFFRHCFRAAGLNPNDVDDNFDLSSSKGGDRGGQPRWKFVYNDPDKREVFLDTLFLNNGFNDSEIIEKDENISTLNDEPELLSVWSPYWAQDIPALVEQLRSKAAGSLDIEFYPDFIAKDQPRFSHDQIEICKQHDVEYFCRDPGSAEPERFSHAKIWRTRKSFAVGSWNCTYAALDLGTSHTSNIEAGMVVYTSDSSMLPRRPDNAEKIAIDSLEGVSEEDTKDESNNRGEVPPLRVFFDWEKLEYDIQWDDVSGFSPDNWRLRLPGIANDIKGVDLRTQKFILLPSKANELIASRLCTIWKVDEIEKLFYLYVAERGIKGDYRPSLRYKDLDELFRHLQTHTRTDNIGDSGGGTLNVPPDQTHSIDESAYEENALQEGNDVASSYFVLFRAFHNKGEEIEAATNLQGLKMSALLAPGNLFEIWEHINSVIYIGNEKEKKLKNSLYNYFLIREYQNFLNRVITQVKKFIDNGANNDLVELNIKKWLQELQRIDIEVRRRREEMERQMKSQIHNESERKAMLAMVGEIYGEQYVEEA